MNYTELPLAKLTLDGFGCPVRLISVLMLYNIL